MKTLNIVKVTFLIILCLTASSFHAVWAEEMAYYEPYPIVFVHGYNNVGVEHKKLWATTVNSFKKYFDDDKGDSKYFTDYEYYQVFDYTEASNGDIDIAAEWLRGYIDYVIKNIPKYQKEEERKVIIVAHSSGGLVTKRFLAKYPDYKNKIKRAVFIGTPHLGSPLASGLILMDRLRPELERMKESDRVGLKRMSCGTVEENEQYVAYLERYNAISNALDWYKEVVKFNIKPLTIGNMFAGYRERYDPKLPHDQGQKVTLGQLVVPERMTGSKTFTGTCLWKGKVVAKAPPLTTEPAFYEKGDTFINNRNFELPSDYKVIMGQGSLMADILGMSATALIESSIDLSGFPAGNTLEDLDRGDGIVTPASQTAIGGEVITVNRSHITETDAYPQILQSLDDPPVIEKISLGSNYELLSYSLDPEELYYVIVKVKDYLLADIEIVEMTAGDSHVDLSEFYDPATRTYKPYFKLKKDFLKERDYTDPYNKLKFHLMPGEFVVRVPGLNYNSNRKIYLKVRNPAKKEASCALYLFSAGTKAIAKEGGFASGDNWSQVKSAAYDNFLASQLLIFTPGVGIQGRDIVWYADICAIGGWIQAWSYRDPNNPPLLPVYAGRQNMIYKHWLNFELDIGNKKVKSIKFTGNLDQPLGYNIYYGPAFNVLAYRDTSDIWPPPLNLEYDGNQFLFTLNTANDKGMLGIELDPQYINLNGNNVWEFKPDFLEYNCIPYPDIVRRDTLYNRGAYIFNPALFVAFEE